MKTAIILLTVVLFCISCKNTKNTPSKVKLPAYYWKTASNIPPKYSSFKVFNLDEIAFKKNLEKGKIFLPDDLGKFNEFEIEKTQTMSEELAKKFPDIKTYKGIQNNNSLCKPRIEINTKRIKIAVFCNNKTYFIDKDKELELYIVYNKKNAPNGMGLVKEN